MLRDPYGFISARCDALETDAFETRIRLEPTICMRGAAAARHFYDPRRFVRAGASPRRVRATLFGEGGVQGMDGAPHRHRKAVHTGLMTPEAIAELVALSESAWRRRIARWTDSGRDRIVLYDEAAELMCEVVCRWTDVPVAEEEVPRLTGDLLAMVEAPGSLGPGYLRGRLARRRRERWMGRLVRESREGTIATRSGRGLGAIADHRELDGSPLAERTAAVELLSVLRPTDAVARYVVFCAMALHEHPEWRPRLESGDPGDDLRFVQEVRRLSPFFPFVAARVREPFEWSGVPFPAGRLTLLDLYGTNRDARTWEDADGFRPDRFTEREPGPFELIAQGGGDVEGGHRCSGEAITIELTLASLRALLELDYAIPSQDLRMRRSRAPALPESRFVMAEVRARG